MAVEQHDAVVRHKRLILVQVVELDAPCLEHFLDVLGHRLVADQLAAEQLGQGLLRDVVLGGAQTAREDDDVAVTHGLFDRVDDLLTLVADRGALPYDNARRIQMAGDGYRVGIHDLTDQDFVSDRYDGCFHGCC